LKNYCRKDSSDKKNKHAIIVGVIGFPNVGKSSLINSLKRSRVAATGNTPGFTKSIQEVVLDRDIVLLDCPGVIQSTENSESLILRNAIKVEDIKDPIKPIDIML
jgi:nuclear GTP-binding protein